MIDFSDFDRFLRPVAVNVTPKRKIVKTPSKSKYSQLDLSAQDQGEAVSQDDGGEPVQEVDEVPESDLGVSVASDDSFIKLEASELGESTVIADNSDEESRAVSFVSDLKRSWSAEGSDKRDVKSYKKLRLSECIQSQETPRSSFVHEYTAQDGPSQQVQSSKLIIKNKKHKSPLIQNLDGQKQIITKKKKTTKKLFNSSLDHSLLSDSEDEVRLSEDSDGESRRSSRKKTRPKRTKPSKANHEIRSHDHNDRPHLSNDSDDGKHSKRASMTSTKQRRPHSVVNAALAHCNSVESDQDQGELVIEDSPSQHPPLRSPEEEELANMPKVSLLCRAFERMERRLSRNKWVRHKPELARPLLQVIQRWKLSNLNFSTRHSTLNSPEHPLLWLRLEITSEPVEEFQRVYVPTKVLVKQDQTPSSSSPSTEVESSFTEGRNQVPPVDSTILLAYHQPLPLDLRLLLPGTILHLYQDWLIYQCPRDKDTLLKSCQFFIFSGYNLEIGD